ncbi:DUF2178 domain-containing protein [Pontibacillus yanchengensis]|uniref:DUF2178 domain-containing protein n=1 Tax=Pontibacillus yanchengensis Y32 TaxID=1385514 RepID=A0A0A2TFR0_9BACI|nr:DUF2178 domain-containing protein [Pontibacillus yanchengensis]KGP74697.1 hypothetical protein N782_00620 [Pontibacillus yanchengensis Y32]
MSKKMFRVLVLFVVIGIFLVTFYVDMYKQSTLIPIGVATLGAIIIQIGLSNIKEGTSDQHSKKIEDKAAKATLTISLLVASIGSVLISFQNEQISTFLTGYVSFTIITFILIKYIYKKVI